MWSVFQMIIEGENEWLEMWSIVQMIIDRRE